jgi:hypothetical protein
MKRLKFTVGQPLLFRPKNHRGDYQEPRIVLIEKVGTKWLTARDAKARQPLRISRADLTAAAAGFNLGECYLDHDDYETREARAKAYEQLRRELPYRMPLGITLTDIHTARDRLGLLR